MTTLNAHVVYDDKSKPIAYVHQASREAVDFVLAQDENSPDGRSQYVWVRLLNGDVVLGVYPQGEAYFGIEDDAVFPGEIVDGSTFP